MSEVPVVTNYTNLNVIWHQKDSVSSWNLTQFVSKNNNLIFPFRGIINNIVFWSEKAVTVQWEIAQDVNSESIPIKSGKWDCNFDDPTIYKPLIEIEPNQVLTLIPTDPSIPIQMMLVVNVGVQRLG